MKKLIGYILLFAPFTIKFILMTIELGWGVLIATAGTLLVIVCMVFGLILILYDNKN